LPRIVAALENTVGHLQEARRGAGTAQEASFHWKRVAKALRVRTKARRTGCLTGRRRVDRRRVSLGDEDLACSAQVLSRVQWFSPLREMGSGARAIDTAVRGDAAAPRALLADARDEVTEANGFSALLYAAWSRVREAAARRGRRQSREDEDWETQRRGTARLGRSECVERARRFARRSCVRSACFPPLALRASARKAAALLALAEGHALTPLAAEEVSLCMIHA
jgi:hypothetical protein